MVVRGDDVVSLIRRRREPLAVALVLLIALALRVYQYDWDQGHMYHPDERFILLSTAAITLPWPIDFARLLTPQSPLIPENYSYSYGTLSLYVLRLAAAILVAINHLFPFLHFLDSINDFGNLRLVGRPISALFDTATVYLIYRIGRQLYGRRTALLAAALVAFSAIDIQLSHFYATDTIMTCLVIAAIALSVSYLRTGHSKSALWAGAFAGLALATKASALTVFAPVVAAYVLRLFLTEDRSGVARLRAPKASTVSATLEIGLGALAAAVLAFIIAEPYAIIDFRRFIGGVLEQSNMVRGLADLPYTRQYFDRPAYLYLLENLVLFGAGVPLGLAMLGGWLYTIVRNVFRPRAGDLLLLSYVIPYFAITGDFWAKFLRYMLPISPLLALFAAVALIRLIDLFRRWSNRSASADELFDRVELTALTLPPELVGEEFVDASEVEELAFFDGDGTIPLDDRSLAADGESSHGTIIASLVATTTESQTPPVVRPVDHADAVDPELWRWLEIKGLSPEIWGIEAPALTGNGPLDRAPEPVSTLDAETQRFAELKGLSLDWFEEPTPSPAATATVDRPSEVARAQIAVAVEPADGWPMDQDRLAGPPGGSASLPKWLIENKVLGPIVTGPWPTRVARGVAGIVIVFSAFNSVAFANMYTSTTPPVLGSQWLYQNAPRGSVIATEHWEEGMPVPILNEGRLDSNESHNFRNITMPLYEDDNPGKLNLLVSNLATADYVVFFSNRLYGTVPRIPGRYPMSQRYYEKLFGEKLGFTLVDAEARYPNLFGIAFVDDTLADPGLPVPQLLQSQRPAPVTINLGHADESFSVYDHQKVLIFKKTEKLTPDQLRALIGPPPTPDQLAPQGNLSAPKYRSLLLTPVQEAVVQAGGTFHDLFGREDVFNQVPLLDWIILTALIGFAGAPLGFRVFRFLPDRGYMVSKTLGVLVLVWLSWMVVSLGIVQATRLQALGALIGLLALGGVAAYLQRRELSEFWRERRRLILFEEGLFWVAFLYDVYVRSLNPDLWHPALGGEKPMDLAYLNAAIRSPTYPPYDPWFANGYLNYYYFGQIIVGTLTKISGVLPTTAFNLIVPLLFALTVVGAFSTALALIHRDAGTPTRVAVAGSVLASLMVCVLGNIGGFFQLVTQLGQVTRPGAVSSIPLVGPAVGILQGVFLIVTGSKPFNIPPDWYWSSTRMLALLEVKGGTGSINEFPYFTFLFADLHAHLIGLPFTLLAIALCVNIVKSGGLFRRPPATEALPPDGSPATRSFLGIARADWMTGTVVLVTAGLVAGALYPTNSWDYPTYVGLLALSLAIPWYLSFQRNGLGLAIVAAQVSATVILSQLLYRPFYASFQSFYSGVHLSDERSEIRWYFVINGFFLVIMLSYFLLEGWATYRRSGFVRAIRLYVGKWDLLPRTLQLQQVLVKSRGNSVNLTLYGIAALVIAAAALVLGGLALAGILLVVLVAALALGLRRQQSPEDTLVSLMFATGLAISIGTEIVVIDGDVGRMNTIFKFYEQIWVLFGVAGAVALVRMWDRLRGIRFGWLRWTWVAVIVAFFVMTAVYPVMATVARVSQRFATDIPPTLDGTAYMDRAVYVDTDDQTRVTAPLHFATDKAAITWLQDNVVGTPNILEGTRPLYRWGSRIAIYTGLPTVIGWDWHQKQQRWGFQNQIDERLGDVRLMYESPSVDTTLSLLHKYDVTYIIDGETERAFYPHARAKLDSMVGTYLTVAYDQSGVRIYQLK